MTPGLLRLPLLAALFAVAAHSQQGTGTISGSVSDPQGASVANAPVELVQVDTQATFRTLTNDQGNYTAPGLAVGRYEVRAQFAGFKRAVRAGVVLQVAQNARVDLVLELGSSAESVRVTAEAPLVDTGSATLGHVIENRRIQELPLNGRSALALTALTAGVVSNAGPTQSGFGDRGVALSSLSINGSPNAMNAQMLDGNNNTLSYVGEVSIPPAVDAVEEFRVQSGPMSAEFGFTAGGSINLVTKSGTNQFHGSLYHFLRNDKLDARNTFAATKLPFRYNQFGGALGGPILKSRLFGFVNYEKYLSRRSTPRIATVPIQAWREGDFSGLRNAQGALIPVYDPATTAANPNGTGLVRTPFPGNVIPRNRLDAAALRVLSYFPLPNKAPINAFTQSQNYQDAAQNTIDWNQLNYRVDYRISDAHAVFVRYTEAQHDPFASSIFTEQTVGDARDDDQTNRNAVATHTWTLSPTTISSLRAGLNRQAFSFAAQSAGDWSTALGLPGSMVGLQFPQIDFGYGSIGGGAVGFRSSLNWDVQEMLTRVAGNHTVKAGVNYRLQQGNNQQGNALGGTYNFGGLTSNPQTPAGTGANIAQFLLGEVTSATVQRVTGASWQGASWSVFVQDDWKLARRFTANLGLRWDWQQRPYERNNGQVNFDLSRRDPVTGLAGLLVFAGRDGQPRTFIDESYRDFGPRLGWAWDLFGSGRTVLRGGYGVFYPSIFFRPWFGDTQFFSNTTTNYVASGIGQPAFRFQNGLPFDPAGSPGISIAPNALLGQNVSLREADSHSALTQQWTVSVQHEVAGWLLEATYAGNKGNHFVSSNYNINQLPLDQRRQLGQALFDNVANPLVGRVPGALGAAQVSRERTLLPYPQYQAVSVLGPRIGNYNSHQLQLNLRRRLSSGLFVGVAYTGGKKMSDSNTTPTLDFGYDQTGEIGFQDGYFNRQLNKAVDPLDVSQRGVVTLLYDLPFGAGKRWSPGNRLARAVVGGWQVNAIGIMQTGLPLVVRGANNFASDRPNSTGVSPGLDSPTAQRWFNTDAFVNPPSFTLGNVGRTIPNVRGPGTVNWDLSVLKNTSVREGVNLQLRAEAFNFLNHVNLGTPNGTFTAGPDGRNANANFGTITTARDARVIQLALKLLF